MSSLIPDTSSLHSLANSLRGKEVSTFTSHTFVIIVSLAILDFTISIFKFVWFVAFFADMVNFCFATQDRVHNTDVVVKTEAMEAVGTNLFVFVREFGTVLHSFNTSSSLKVEAYIIFNSTSSTVDASSKAIFLKAAQNVGFLTFAIDHVETCPAFKARSISSSGCTTVLSSLSIKLAESRLFIECISVITFFTSILSLVRMTSFYVSGLNADTERVRHITLLTSEG